MTETPIPHKFKVGDRVYNKNRPTEAGEIVAISYTGYTLRVMLDPPVNKLYWYHWEEIEVSIAAVCAYIQTY